MPFRIRRAGRLAALAMRRAHVLVHVLAAAITFAATAGEASAQGTFRWQQVSAPGQPFVANAWLSADVYRPLVQRGLQQAGARTPNPGPGKVRVGNNCYQTSLLGQAGHLYVIRMVQVALSVCQPAVVVPRPPSSAARPGAVMCCQWRTPQGTSACGLYNSADCSWRSGAQYAPPYFCHAFRGTCTTQQ